MARKALIIINGRKIMSDALRKENETKLTQSSLT